MLLFVPRYGPLEFTSASHVACAIMQSPDLSGRIDTICLLGMISCPVLHRASNSKAKLRGDAEIIRYGINLMS